jgi:hypothetical protein
MARNTDSHGDLSLHEDGRLGVCLETVQKLEEAEVTIHVCDSEQAVSLYNRLIETELVGALVHSTC